MNGGPTTMESRARGKKAQSTLLIGWEAPLPRMTSLNAKLAVPLSLQRRLVENRKRSKEGNCWQRRKSRNLASRRRMSYPSSSSLLHSFRFSFEYCAGEIKGVGVA